jgi:putative addiction module CopG family antidote
MRLSLSPETQELIGAKLKTGQYESADDVVRASLAALEQQEQFGDFAPGELDELLAEGERSILKEGTIAAEVVFAELRKHGTGRMKPTSRRGKSL